MNRQRSIIEYELDELTIIRKESEIFNRQVELNSLLGKNIIFENQKLCGKEVINIFNNNLSFYSYFTNELEYKNIFI